MGPSRGGRLSALIASLALGGAASAFSGPATAKAPSGYEVLLAEYQRSTSDPGLFKDALASRDPRVIRVGLRALGRLERPEWAPLVAPYVSSGPTDQRRAAVMALAQMGAPFDFGSRLEGEKEPSVRAALYEALGRQRPGTVEAERLLATGLTDREARARLGAARGLEWLVRIGGKARILAPETLDALRRAVRESKDSALRQYGMLALNLANAADEGVWTAVLGDPDPQVRRLGVLASRRFVDDLSPMVRLESVRVAGTCESASRLTRDPSRAVALAAIDALGTLKCAPERLEEIADTPGPWPERAHAVLALARAQGSESASRVRALAATEPWQARAYAARAARALKDPETLSALAHDRVPNVVAEALTAADEALAALESDHSGLLVAAATRLRELPAPDRTSMAGRLVATILRVTSRARVTVRDERLALLGVLSGVRDATLLQPLEPLLKDRDPEVAARVASLLSEARGLPVKAVTTRYEPPPFPSEQTLRALEGATARLAIRGRGVMTLALDVEEAPATVAVFARLAESGAYNGLTFHRVVPNFVLQGGSPGADEFDALSPDFMRDEVGETSHVRGTLGISTRGRDTGDGQIFINLIDNGRLDHAYSVFAKITSGFDVVDQVVEGDVIESVTVTRKR